MRHKLNLNGPSARIVSAIVLSLAVLPALLYLSAPVCRALHLPAAALRRLIWLSLGIGASLAALFTVLVVVEQIQDRHLDRVYVRNRHRKLRLADGRYECQYCGNREVREADSRCSACGRALSPGP